MNRRMKLRREITGLLLSVSMILGLLVPVTGSVPAYAKEAGTSVSEAGDSPSEALASEVNGAGEDTAYDAVVSDADERNMEPGDDGAAKESHYSVTSKDIEKTLATSISEEFRLQFGR